MGHVNNAKYLTYCEIARLGYWTDVDRRADRCSGRDRAREPDPGRGPDHLPRAGVLRRAADRRDPGDADRADVVHARAPARGRAPTARRRGWSRSANRCSSATTTRPSARPRSAPSTSPRSRRSRASRCALSRRDGPRRLRPRRRRKIATAFWPPNPKPLTATVSTVGLARRQRHVVEVALRVRRVEVRRRRDDLVADRAERRQRRGDARPRRRGGRSSTSAS